MLLSDLGARVIKVENPQGGDDSRAYGPFINGKSGYFISQNRGKESIALDLKAEAERAILHRLLKGADVLVENFRPGTMDRLGLGWSMLKEKYPTLIYAATSGFGQTDLTRSAQPTTSSPRRWRIMSVTGHEGSPRPGSARRSATSARIVHRARHHDGSSSSHADRHRHDGRCGDAGFPGGAAGELDRALLCQRQAAEAFGRTTSIDCTVRTYETRTVGWSSPAAMMSCSANLCAHLG